MRIRLGYDITYECPQPTPMLLLLRVHPTRENDLLSPDEVIPEPAVPVQSYLDGFGNLCSRLTAPAGGAARTRGWLRVGRKRPPRSRIAHLHPRRS
jgi:hypothetical protein